MKKSLTELVVNKKGKIATLDGKAVSKLNPIGKPRIIIHNKLGPEFHINNVLDYLSSKLPSKPNAYLIGEQHYEAIQNYVAIQFYKIKI